MTKARDLANIISGGFTESDIPNLSASKITSGTLDNARITLDANEIPNISTDKLTSGTIPDARLPATALNSNVDLTTLSASNLTSGTLADARFPSTLPVVSGANLTNLPSGGKIGQVISTNVSASNMFTTSSTSYVDVSSATVTITPSASSSKIFHNLTFWQGKTALNTTWYRIINTPSGGSATIIDGTGTSENETWGGSTSGNYLTYNFATNTWNYLHTTNSTVAQVYKLQMRVDSNSSYINRIGAGTTRTATFNWTVMEVLA